MTDISLGGQHCQFGMDVFRSQHGVFSGRVKSKVIDFKVTEIDPLGNLVHLESTADPMPSLSEVAPCITHKTTSDGVKCRRDELHPELKRSSENEVSFDDVVNVEELLSVTRNAVGTQMMDGLIAFAENNLCQNNTEKIASAGLEKTSASECFLLGEVPRKEDRAFLHKSIQCIYPHLKTDLAKEPNGDSSVLRASTNPVYWEFRRCLDAAQTEVIVRFANSRFTSRSVSLEAPGSKEERTVLHRIVSKHFGKYLETKTVATSGKHEIIVRFRRQFVPAVGKGVKRKTEDEGCVYTGFTLKKTNLETLEALQQLSSVLKVRICDFSYAGIKDKKAVTIQRVAVKGIGMQRMQHLVGQASLTNITVGNICPLANPIHLGDLTGNMFDILIRDVQLSPEDGSAILIQEIDNCLKSVQKNGFINYFGEQRFGASCEGNGSQAAAIGLAMLAGSYQQAVRHLLSPDNAKDDPVNRAKKHYALTQNAKQALALMPTYKSRECLVLKALHRHGAGRDGCMRALYSIPHAMRKFYVHSFCSLVWNHMASARWRMYEDRVVVGDLVMIVPAGEGSLGTRDMVKVVTDAEAATYSIKDVVLPLPGNSIIYPSNGIGEEYTRYLSEEVCLATCTYRVNELQINVPGDYRRLIEWPRDLQWKLEVSPGRPGCDSDTAVEHCDTGNSTSPKSGSNFSKASKVDSPGSELVGGTSSNRGTDIQVANLRVNMKLPSSTYATVFLRELMKM